MTNQELLTELTSRKALIVHCSRPGKGNEGVNALLFPCDLLQAVSLCDTGKKEICCSVIWPKHVEAFGDIGIILKPRSTKAITLISTTDGGTYIDPASGKRVGDGVPFSQEAVTETFTNSIDYNEWNINDADTIGIFVKNDQTPQVASRFKLSELSGYDPIMGTGTTIAPRNLALDEIKQTFPDLPVLTIYDGEIRDMDGYVVSPYV